MDVAFAWKSVAQTLVSHRWCSKNANKPLKETLQGRELALHVNASEPVERSTEGVLSSEYSPPNRVLLGSYDMLLAPIFFKNSFITPLSFTPI